MSQVTGEWIKSKFILTFIPSLKQSVVSFFIFLTLLNDQIVLVKSTCPDVPAEELYPCFCFSDTNDLFCRGMEGRELDDVKLAKITKLIAEKSTDKKFSKLTLTQTDITSLDGQLFSGFTFDEIVIRFNFKLRSIAPNTFESSKGTVRNISFGELGSYYETQNMTPVDLAFLTTFTSLRNVFLSGINIGHFDPSVFKKLTKDKVNLYLNSLVLSCNCNNKWLITDLSLEERRSYFGSLALALRDSAPIVCKSSKLNGVMIPIRALTLADFKECP